MGIDVRPLGEDTHGLRDVISQSFGFAPQHWDDFLRRIGPENFRVAIDGTQVVGGLGMYRMGQWWGGRRLDVAGFAAVGVGSPWRGLGHGRTLMAETLREIYDEGEPLAALYPSTTAFYRELGFEQAGHRVGRALALSQLPRMKRSLPMTERTPGHFTDLSEIHKLMGRQCNGTLSRTVGLWERQQRKMGEEMVWTWEIGEGEGYVIACKATPGPTGPLEIRDHVCLTPAALQTFWAFASQYRTMAETLRWWGPASDPLVLAGPVQAGISTHWELRWMLRVIRVAEALTLRGYPEDVEEELGLAVVDPLLTGNTGRYTLTVSQGHGEVRPGASSAIDIDIRGLSVLYSGLYDAATLERMGVFSGDAEQVAAAARIFRGTSPWMSDMF